MPERREFPTVGHELGTFARLGAVDAKNLVVGAGQQGIAGLVVGLVAIPDRDPLQPDDRGFVVFRQCDINAAAFAIDAAAEADFAAGVFGDGMIAKPLESKLPGRWRYWTPRRNE
jgi:hypothetical protein